MKKLSIFLALCLMLAAFGATAQAAPQAFRFDGNIAISNDIVNIAFTVEEKRTITLFTQSQSIDAGLALWDASGKIIAVSEDANKGKYTHDDGTDYSMRGVDAFIKLELEAGVYMLSFVPWLGGTWLDAQGHQDIGSLLLYREGQPEYAYNKDYVFNVLGADNAWLLDGKAPAVPVPAAVWLMGTGLAGIGALRKKIGK